LSAVDGNWDMAFVQLGRRAGLSMVVLALMDLKICTGDEGELECSEYNFLARLAF
jgi:hypothetical protein